MDTRELQSHIIPSGSQARSEGESLRQQARSVQTSRMKPADCSGAASNGSQTISSFQTQARRWRLRLWTGLVLQSKTRFFQFEQ